MYYIKKPVAVTFNDQCSPGFLGQFRWWINFVLNIIVKYMLMEHLHLNM